MLTLFTPKMDNTQTLNSFGKLCVWCLEVAWVELSLCIQIVFILYVIVGLYICYIFIQGCWSAFNQIKCEKLYNFCS